jgi:hypothetical protein
MDRGHEVTYSFACCFHDLVQLIMHEIRFKLASILWLVPELIASGGIFELDDAVVGFRVVERVALFEGTLSSMTFAVAHLKPREMCPYDSA